MCTVSGQRERKRGKTSQIQNYGMLVLVVAV